MGAVVYHCAIARWSLRPKSVVSTTHPPTFVLIFMLIMLSGQSGRGKDKRRIPSEDGCGPHSNQPTSTASLGKTKLTHNPGLRILDSSLRYGVCFHYGCILEERGLSMATLTIKNVPETLHKRLKESAVQHRRSINSEAISCLEKVLVATRVDPQEFLAEVRAMRERMPSMYVTEEFLRAAKNEGRP